MRTKGVEVPDGEGAQDNGVIGPAAAAVAIISVLVGGSILSAHDKKLSLSEAGPVAEAPAALSPAPPSPSPVFAQGPSPADLPGIASDQGAPANLSISPEMVVKFKNDARVKPIIDQFWKNPIAARKAFLELRSKRPDLSGLTLDRVTYSNELVLVPDASSKKPMGAKEMREIARKLTKSPDIEYAEVTMTAHPGGDK
ncbi:MAG: hypothetical protein KGS00_01360 [Alphaproteobacteria bacterium]|nr:hypothetical protein [Alphaproteobacteria bacterium]